MELPETKNCSYRRGFVDIENNSDTADWLLLTSKVVVLNVNVNGIQTVLKLFSDCE